MSTATSASMKIASAVEPVVELIAADTALLSLRSSGHDYNSAVGEVIDNSLQADANNIRCRIFTEKKVIGKNKKATEVVQRVAVGDDGNGMNEDTLHNSLKLGYSSRYDDRMGMGRFGVGAKMGGISQAKRIDIYSRQSKEDPWLHTHIDLDEISAGRMKFIPKPDEAEIPKDCRDLVGDKGTLVIWSKTDRLEETEAGGGRRADTVRTDLMNYIARTFRKFIDSGRNIELDGVKVFPHDPLFLMTSTRFHQPDAVADPVAEIKVNEGFEFPLPSDPTKTSRVEVTLTLLPKEFRMVRLQGGSEFVTSRRIDENEGISILRADREIFNGWLKGVQPSQEGRPIDRFIGKEIRFEPALDECFHVRNVKKGAEPIEGLRDKLREVIFKSITTLREDIRRHFDDVEKQTLQEQGLHAEAEKVAAETQRTARKSKAGQDTPKEERDKEIDAAAESLTRGVPEELKATKKAQVKAKIETQPFTIVPETWRGQEFMEIKHLGSTVIVRLNMQHPFYTEVYSKLIGAEKQEEDQQKKELARQVRNGIDLLIVGYARGEGQYDDPSIFDNLRTNWGMELKSLIQHWVKKQ
ncbi:MAG TPA: ATP-binding protein [Tepidisphaeraceae bacterium]|nr:ATP-binding protein [Tepidisphaeraceae bacterium]